jgi:hypothetical protein
MADVAVLAAGCGHFWLVAPAVVTLVVMDVRWAL